MNGIKSLSDLFNSSDAVINDPYVEIHTACQEADIIPSSGDYEDFIEDLDTSFYPKPKDTVTHYTVNPLHGALKSVYK